MSKNDKKEITNEHTSHTSSSNNSRINNHNQEDIYQNNQKLYNKAVEQASESLEQSLEESKKSIERNMQEAKNQIPRNTETVNEVQEQTIQATKDIAESYMEYQKQAIDSFQSIYTPYLQNINNQLWKSQDYFRRMPEMYSKLVNNYAENTIAINRIFNDMAFLNLDLFKNMVNNTKKQSKHLTEIGKRNVSVYEQIEKDNKNSFSSSAS